MKQIAVIGNKQLRGNTHCLINVYIYGNNTINLKLTFTSWLFNLYQRFATFQINLREGKWVVLISLINIALVVSMLYLHLVKLSIVREWDSLWVVEKKCINTDIWIYFFNDKYCMKQSERDVYWLENRKIRKTQKYINNSECLLRLGVLRVLCCFVFVFVRAILAWRP